MGNFKNLNIELRRAWQSYKRINLIVYLTNERLK